MMGNANADIIMTVRIISALLDGTGMPAQTSFWETVAASIKDQIGFEDMTMVAKPTTLLGEVARSNHTYKDVILESRIAAKAALKICWLTLCSYKLLRRAF